MPLWTVLTYSSLVAACVFTVTLDKGRSLWSPYASNTVQLMYVCISFNVQDIKLHLLIKMKLVFPYICWPPRVASQVKAIRFTWVTIPGPATCDVKTSVALKVKYRSSHKLQTYKTVLAAPCPPARPPACSVPPAGSLAVFTGSRPEAPATPRVIAAAPDVLKGKLIYSSPEFFQR